MYLASRLNVLKRTPATAGRKREGGGREAREGGVHCCRQNVIKRTRAPAGREMEQEGEGGEGGEGGRRALSQVKCRHVRLTTAHSLNPTITI